MKCVSTVYSCTGMIWSWRVKWPDFKTLPLCYVLCRHDTLTHLRSWINKSLPIVKEIAQLPPLRFSPVFFSPPPAFSPEDLNKEIQIYQGKAPDKARAVLAISHRRMPRPKVCESNFCSLYWGLISARMITSLHIKGKTSTLLSTIIIGPERPSTERRMLTV